MKTLLIEEAEGHLKAVCEEALAGEVIRLQMSDGSLLELTLIRRPSGDRTADQLAQCYHDNEWAAFENRCGAASD